MSFLQGKFQNDKDDIARAKAGDRDAFVRLVEEYKLSLYKVGRSYLRSEEDIADAMSETVLKAFQSIGKLRENRYFKTWLTRIMIHECTNILRKNQRQVLVEEFDQNQLVHEEQFYEGQEVFHQVQQLPKEMAQVIVLFYYEDHSCQTIAKLLDIPESTVRTRLNRARKKLRGLLRLQIGGDSSEGSANR